MVACRLARLDPEWMTQASREDVADLLARDAAVDAQAKHSETPLHMAAARWNENPAVAALLLDRGADPSLRDAEGRFPADLAEGNDTIGGSDVSWCLNDGRF